MRPDSQCVPNPQYVYRHHEPVFFVGRRSGGAAKTGQPILTFILLERPASPGIEFRLELHLPRWVSRWKRRLSVAPLSQWICELEIREGLGSGESRQNRQSAIGDRR